jgi:ribosomal protein S18 acetylase RimI-like enzyme
MISIRRAKENDTAAIARIHIDMWRVAYDEILSPDFLRSLSYSRSKSQWQSVLERHANVLYVADSPHDGVVGFAAGGAERTRAFNVDGELMALYVLTSAHGRGAGSGLTRAVAQDLHENGRNGMVVWVLADNSARRFYEHLGARETLRSPMSLAGTTVERVAYVWDDLPDLINP